jgi:dTDP-4-dehydrorhamnose reductase
MNMRDGIKVLVTGANGQVGHELLRTLGDIARDPDPHPAPRAKEKDGVSRHFSRKEKETVVNPSPVGRGAGVRVRDREIIAATRSGHLEDGTACEAIDLADFDGLARALDRIAPDVIINAAAYTAVDRAEDETEAAMRINGEALGVLGAWARRHDARVVHYSTDYVFDGRASAPYREGDATHPVSVYGRTKLAGEDALRDSGARHLIFRTAWVYAARGHNFMRTMLRLGAERDQLRVVDDQVGAPTPARLIADVTAQSVEQWTQDETATRDGVYHLVATGRVSWCGFAKEIFERAQRAGLLDRVPSVATIRTADYPTKATRPAFSVLDTAKLRGAFDIALPNWQAALDGVIDELRLGPTA